MQAFALIGPFKFQEEYISLFIEKNKVPSYLISRYLDMKILDARTLQKTISYKLKEKEVRLIIISNPTLEAQNALLKTVEELPPQTFLFFCSPSEQDLLPTIMSRAQTVMLQKEEVMSDEALEQKMRQALKEKSFALTITDHFGPTLEMENIESLILIIRNILLSDDLSQTSRVSTLLETLKNLHKNYKFAKNNNINKRMVIEGSVLESFC